MLSLKAHRIIILFFLCADYALAMQLQEGWETQRSRCTRRNHKPIKSASNSTPTKAAAKHDLLVTSNSFKALNLEECDEECAEPRELSPSHKKRTRPGKKERKRKRLQQMRKHMEDNPGLLEKLADRLNDFTKTFWTKTGAHIRTAAANIYEKMKIRGGARRNLIVGILSFLHFKQADGFEPRFITTTPEERANQALEKLDSLVGSEDTLSLIQDIIREQADDLSTCQTNYNATLEASQAVEKQLEETKLVTSHVEVGMTALAGFVVVMQTIQTIVTCCCNKQTEKLRQALATAETENIALKTVNTAQAGLIAQLVQRCSAVPVQRQPTAISLAVDRGSQSSEEPDVAAQVATIHRARRGSGARSRGGSVSSTGSGATDDNSDPPSSDDHSRRPLQRQVSLRRQGSVYQKLDSDNSDDDRSSQGRSMARLGSMMSRSNTDTESGSH